MVTVGLETGLGQASRGPRILFDEHQLGRGQAIGLGSLPFYCPRDAGSYLSQKFNLYDGILELVSVVRLKSFDVDQHIHVPAVRLKPITPEEPHYGAGHHQATSAHSPIPGAEG